jgi:hypothetical protein
VEWYITALDTLNHSIPVVTSPPQTVSLDESGHIRSACGNAGPLFDFDKKLAVNNHWRMDTGYDRDGLR